jgi:fumarate hydratase class II
MGDVEIPAESLYGASTQRAVENFRVSGFTLPPNFLTSLGVLKRICAEVNVELGELSEDLGRLIMDAAQEVADGRLHAHFPIDVFQTGSGTSTNMNVNEVIANRCSQLTGHPLGSKDPVHPNDHVNLGQSSNDIMPSALHLSVALAIRDTLLPALKALEDTLLRKAEQWHTVIKLGRTHLMDATPITLGQEFSGYARQISKARSRFNRAMATQSELAIGGTAVGTGINTHPKFAQLVCRRLSEKTGLEFREAENHFEAQSCRDDSVEVAGHLSTLAAALTKIANDIRLLGSGPRAGLAELNLPATQPGSSIMPGKVNPVMSEMLVQSAHYSIGLCQTVTRCGQDGQLDLNATIPLIAHCLLTSIKILANSTQTFADRCVSGLEANEARCLSYAENALGLATALNSHIGYDKAAEIAKKAFDEGQSIKEIALRMRVLDEATLARILDPAQMLGASGHLNTTTECNG